MRQEAYTKLGTRGLSQSDGIVKVLRKLIAICFDKKLVRLSVCLGIIPQWSKRDVLVFANACSGAWS